MVLTTIIALYTARVFLNVLGTSDYGIYTLVAGVVFMFGFLQDTLTRASLRYLCFYKVKSDLTNQRRVFTISMSFHLIVSFLIFLNLLILYPFLFSGFLNIEADRVEAAQLAYFFMVISFVFTVMSIPFDSVLNANENMLYFSIIGIAESFFKLLLTFYLPFCEFDKLIFYSLYLSVITIISMLVKQIYCKYKYGECRFRLVYFDRKIAKGMITYAGYNFLTSITSLFTFNSIPILLNIFFGTVVNAAQGIASQVNGVLSQFSTNLTKALAPTITKSGGINEIDRLKKYGLAGSKLSFIIFGIFAIPIIIECPYILKIWLVNVPDWTTVFCIFLLIRSLTFQLITVYIDCIYANSNIRNYCIIKSILNILPIFLVYYSFKMGGEPYMVYVLLFSCWEILGGVVVMYYNNKLYNLNIKDYLSQLIYPCTFVVVVECSIGYSISALMDSSFLRLIISSFSVSFIFLLFSWYMILNKTERVIVINMLSQLNRKR